MEGRFLSAVRVLRSHKHKRTYPPLRFMMGHYGIILTKAEEESD